MQRNLMHHHLNCILFHLNSIHEIFLPILIRFSYVNFNIVQRVIVSLMMILMGNISPLVLGKFHIIILNSWKLSSLKNYKKKKKKIFEFAAPFKRIYLFVAFFLKFKYSYKIKKYKFLNTFITRILHQIHIFYV